MNLQVVRVEVQDYVAVVTLDNPPVNALDRRMHEDVALAFDTLGDREDTRCIVLTGAGKHFSAGAEIKQRASHAWEPGEIWQHSRRTRECFHSIVECRKPVVAALHGATLGAGLALAASSDILVCAEDTMLGLPEIDVGLLGGARHAMRLFGHSKLRRLMLTGQRLTGAELYRLGVVEACVPPAQLMDAAMEVARTIAAKSPIATVMAKEALNLIEEMSLRDGYRFEQNFTAAIRETEDAREAMRAFGEKRAPVFKGR